MGNLYISPANLLEIQFLLEAQRIRLRPGMRIDDFASDDRWVVDDPPAAAWFDVARELTWHETRSIGFSLHIVSTGDGNSRREMAIYSTYLTLTLS